MSIVVLMVRPPLKISRLRSSAVSPNAGSVSSHRTTKSQKNWAREFTQPLGWSCTLSPSLVSTALSACSSVITFSCAIRCRTTLRRTFAWAALRVGL